MNHESGAEFGRATENYLLGDICKNYCVVTLLPSVVEENNRNSVFSDKLKNKKLTELIDKIYLINDKTKSEL